MNAVFQANRSVNPEGVFEEFIGGGAICTRKATLSMANSLFFDNNTTGLGRGGAILGWFSQHEVQNITVARNDAAVFAGVYLNNVDENPPSDGDAIYNNSIFWFNEFETPLDPQYQIEDTQIFGDANPPGSIQTVAYSCIQDEDPDDASIPWGGSANGNIDDDPLFVDLTGSNFRLSAASPCLDAGDSTVMPEDTDDLDEDLITTCGACLAGERAPDLDLQQRVRDVARIDTGVPDDDCLIGCTYVIDMGAYEAFSCFELNCTTPVSTFPFIEDFEDDALCNTACQAEVCLLLAGGFINLNQIQGDKGEWIVHEFLTPTIGTGPVIDASSGTTTGNYVYTESSGSECQNVPALLLSPCIDLAAGQLLNPTLIFAYHMYGSEMGSLHVDVSIDDCTEWEEVWSISGQQQGRAKDPWLHGEVPLWPYETSSNVRIRFRGVTGPGQTSDMALDDIRIGERALGSCCYGTGDCAVVSIVGCEALGGQFTEGGACATDCGACCAIGGVCTFTSEANCPKQLAKFHPGATCAETPCFTQGPG